MPRYNRTGPRGLGPRTGRGLGFCAPSRRFRSRQPRFRFGRRHRYY